MASGKAENRKEGYIMKNKEIIRTINTTINMDSIKKALKEESGIIAQICENAGYASDRLKAKDFETKKDFESWKKQVDAIRVNAYSLAIARKDGYIATGVKADNLYYLMKTLFSTFNIKVKLDGKTAEYLISKSIKTGTGKSVDILKREAEIRDYRKQERISGHPDMFKKEIETLKEEISALKKVACNQVKTDAIVSESVFRKTVEDYIAHRVMGIATII